MAKTILPIAGAVVGAFFGAPQIGFAIGSLIAGAIPGEAQGPRIGETGAQTSQEGSPRAIIYGTAMCSGNVIASGPLIKRDVEENQGGKGGTDVSTEHAYRSYAVRVSEPIAAYLRIWEDDKLVYDMRTGSTMLAESEKWAANKVFYFGGEDQLPDPTLQMIFGVDEVPAHRGSAYVVFIEQDLTDRRGSIPQYRFEVAGAASLAEVLEPLVVNPWKLDAGRPVHRYGATEYRNGVGVGTPVYVYADAVELNAQAYADEFGSTPVYRTAGLSRTFIGYRTSANAVIDKLPGGAGLVDSPESVLYQMGFELPGKYLVAIDSCIVLQAEASTVPLYTDAVNGYSPALLIGIVGDSLPPPIDGYDFGVQCGSTYGFINYVSTLYARRVPAPSEDLLAPEIIEGTAKQLCAIQYRDGVLYQNALGPVLLPGDPNYENESWWQDRRDDAVAAGIMAADVAYPLVVERYVHAYSTGSGKPIPLSQIVDDIHARCDFPVDKVDTSELHDLVAGLVLAGEYSGADAINTLRSLYLFDRADFDKKIHYPKRGAAVVATLNYDDLVEEPDTSRREQAIEYPKKLHLGYQNAVGGYAVAKATSSRSSPDVRVVGETTMQVPVVLNPDQAAQAAAILHKVAYAEAEGEVKLSVPDSFLRFVPSNCIGLALRGRVSRLRIEQMDVAAGIIELTLRHDRQSAYTSNVTGVPIPAPTPPPPTIVGDSVLAVIDISARVDSEDDLHYLVAATGGMPAWNGATVQRSLDGGASYVNAASVGRGIIMGSLVNDVPVSPEHYTDVTTVIRVRLFRDTLRIEDITETQFLSEGGAFVIMRPDGSSEVLQYRDAVEVSTGVFDMSHLHRGQLNSGASAHLAGAVLVGLSRAVHVDAQSAWIGADLTHRAVSNGESPELAAEQTEIFTAKSQTEWPVAYLALARSGGTVTATWTPRHRFGSDDAPVASINFQGYRVTLDDGVLAPVVFDTPTAAFSTDASALGSPLSVSVSALNRITGAGPTVSESI